MSGAAVAAYVFFGHHSEKVDVEAVVARAFEHEKSVFLRSGGLGLRLLFGSGSGGLGLGGGFAAALFRFGGSGGVCSCGVVGGGSFHFFEF